MALKVKGVWGGWFLLDGERNVPWDHASVDKVDWAAYERLEESFCVFHH